MKITQYLKPDDDESANELIARIMIKQNCVFRFFDNPDVGILFKKAFPSKNVYFIFLSFVIFRCIHVIIFVPKLFQIWRQKIGSKFQIISEQIIMQ